MQKVTVRVPASTSNLGPGFDCLGIALRIYNTVTIRRSSSPEEPDFPIVSEAAARFFRQARIRAFRFSCSIAAQIPRSRGLGSSATIRAGVLLALNRLCGTPLDRETIFRLCADLEGHPDNAAPAIFGGFTVVRSRARGDSKRVSATVQRCAVSSRLRFVLFIPELEIDTSKARNVLPSQISHAAATENCANACAITAAFLSRDYTKMRGAFIDHLHQPFRAKFIPFLPRTIAAAERAGALGAFLSGSGSTITAITVQAAQAVAEAMTRAAKTRGRIMITHADNDGAKIVTSH